MKTMSIDVYFIRLSYSLIIFKIKFVSYTDFPHSEGPVIIQRTG